MRDERAAETETERLVGMARRAEEEGEIRRAAGLYNAALERDEKCVEALRGLAELRRDMGDPKRAARCLERLAELGDERARESVVEVWREHGDAKRAEVALSRLSRLRGPGDPAVAGLEAAFRPETGPPESDPDERLAPTDEDLVAFADIFAGREGMHARQWAARDGRCGYSPVHRRLTPALVRQHVLGAATLGVYPVRRDDSCCFLALDVDSTSPMAELSRGEAREAIAATLAAARELAAALSGLGLDSVVEKSGFKGHHVWVFFERPWPARKARRLGLALRDEKKLPARVSVEVFPAQGRVRPGGLGNLIKLPLGVHLRSGEPSELLESDGSPCRNPFRLLAEVRRAPKEALERALERMSSRDADGEGSGGEDGKTEAADPAGPRAAESPPGMDEARAICLDQYRIDEDEEVALLDDRCPALSSLMARCEAKDPLTHDEQCAITYTLGHLSRGAEAVNVLLEHTRGGTPPLVSRLRGNPMSCAKIRSRLDLDLGEGGCDCVFDPTLGSYPHPLLHLSTLAAERSADSSEPVRDGAERESLEAELERVRVELDRLSRIAFGLERRLGREAGAAVPGPVKAEPSEEKATSAGEGEG
jgi:tetratricopeptide (TPR) repeat protein